MKRLYKWKAWIIPAVILALGLMFWPVTAGPSTAMNPTDNMAENIAATIFVDDAAFTPATSAVTVIGAQADDAATDSVNEGDAGALRMSLDRRLLVDADIAAIVPGVAATDLGKAEDAAHTSGDTGVMLLAVRDDTPPTATGAAGDYVPLLVNDTGNLYVVDEAAAVILGTIDTDTGDIATDTGNMDTSLNDIETATEAAVHIGHTLIYKQINSALSGADVELVAVDGAKVVYVVELLLTATAQCQIAFTDGAETAGAVAPQFYLPAYGGVHLQKAAGYRFSGDASEALAIDAVAGSPSVSGYIWYYQE